MLAETSATVYRRSCKPSSHRPRRYPTRRSHETPLTSPSHTTPVPLAARSEVCQYLCPWSLCICEPTRCPWLCYQAGLEAPTRLPFTLVFSLLNHRHLTHVFPTVVSPNLTKMAEQQIPGANRIDLRVGGKYRLGKKIGSGSFGESLKLLLYHCRVFTPFSR